VRTCRAPLAIVLLLALPMHELAIAIGLVEAICDELPRLGAVRVTAARVRVGRLSGVVPDALTFAFTVAADGTAIAGARLVIEPAADAELALAALEVLDDDASDRRSAAESPEEERRRGGGAAGAVP
jgi:Zn finger protein HypA/HybF involved in hydrogenase expression